MKYQVLTAVIALSATFFTSISFAAPKAFDILPNSPLYRIVEAEVARAFPDEAINSGILTCHLNSDSREEVECDFEFGMYRCDDGGMATRWVRVVADLRDENNPVVQIDNNISGGCSPVAATE